MYSVNPLVGFERSSIQCPVRHRADLCPEELLLVVAASYRVRAGGARTGYLGVAGESRPGYHGGSPRIRLA